MRSYLIVSLLIAACGGKPTPATPAPAPAPRLALAELKIIDEGEPPMEVHADGRIEHEGKVVATVTSDGKLIATKTGEVVLELQADGRVVPSEPPITITAAGEIVTGGKTVSIDPSGVIVGGNADGPRMRVEGARDAGTRRTAMFVLVGISARRPSQ